MAVAMAGAMAVAELDLEEAEGFVASSSLPLTESANEQLSANEVHANPPSSLAPSCRPTSVGRGLGAVAAVVVGISLLALLLSDRGGSKDHNREHEHPRPMPVDIAGPLAFTGLEEVHLSPDEALDRCGPVQLNVEFDGHIVSVDKTVDNPGSCCTVCQEESKCRVWTWSIDGGCTLKHVGPEIQSITKKESPGVTSGLPFNWIRSNSIFCYALMQPVGYENGLIAMQIEKRYNLFACDEYTVVTNITKRLAPGIVTLQVDSDLRCEMGGEFGTALNTDIFVIVWKKVISDGRFRYNDWTVKVDPDSAFFPNRLRVVVAFHPDVHGGTYINNCKFGLHGPLEVLSKDAVQKWGDGYDHCKSHFDRVCSGPCLWGEDLFLDQCLEKVLKLHRVNDWNLLNEPHCDSDNWMNCDNHMVAFHPFKSIDKYEACQKAANYGALPASA